MYTNNIFGTPKKCPTRKCRATLYKDCHLGWLPKSTVEAYAIIRCPKCQEIFAISQMYSDVHDYFESLPNNPKLVKPTSPISEKEHKYIKRKLDDTNILKSLYEGWVPGAGFPIEKTEE
jgi:hypothetical protein